MFWGHDHDHDHVQDLSLTTASSFGRAGRVGCCAALGHLGPLVRLGLTRSQQICSIAAFCNQQLMQDAAF
ncbi:hypothetical protein C0081_01820 [Cohaesibacter celericrescens]|uniref:Uncharacterized protein n=1 Tax=Cohaesibacter celericrescens TaxID=2067669 RepID=A0A2N5XWY3_9HYPH|nr:hypothetical protein C0081_01820 [Cohaesibacter celericrescens]